MLDKKIIEQINNRRVFGIISHPDAGKTTLTEKLLWHGGAIREAGTVSGKKNTKFATSDWMEIEKKRGISVTSSVMQFEYQGKVVSIMDTPGHNDFGEDTYRVLTAVDSAVMVVDAAKGIETQTKKLFAICKQRGIPIFTFINKLDRQAKDSLELIEELESVLGISAVPVTWPIGSGIQFEGIYDILKNKVILYKKKKEIQLSKDGLFKGELDEELHPQNLKDLQEQIELVLGAGNEFNEESIRSGELTPIFFGSALADFGVTHFLEYYLDLAPSPGNKKTTEGEVSPYDKKFTGFIFKIQANMNAAHRDRIAFLRICSGVFERGMTVQLTRNGKTMKLSQSTQLMANDRDIVERAYAGDIIGIYDSGNYQIGDTLVEDKEKLFFEPLPTFPPELFARVNPVHAMKAKHFKKGVDQLAQEGAIQVYHTKFNDIILGAVGELQFEVFEYRLKNEYNSDIYMERMDYSVARWVKDETEDNLEKLSNSRSTLVYDHYNRPVLLFANRYTLDRFAEKNEELRLIEAADVNKEFIGNV